MKIKSLIKLNLMRAAITLALILACAAAWAQTVQNVTYIDENGQTQTVNATQITSDNFRMGSDRWYYVSGTVGSDSDYLYLSTENGTHNLILCDGATLTVLRVNQLSEKYAKLKVYGQSGGTGKLNVGNGNVVNAIHHCDLALYGGEVTLTYFLNGYGTDKNVDFNGGKLTATSGANAIGGNTTINATSGWIKASKYGGSVTIAEGKYMKDETGRYYKGTLTDAEKAAAAGKTLQPATQAEYINYMFGGGNGSQNSPYVISSTEGWNFFCDCLDDNNTWNRFSGKIVKLGANISVSRMAGTSDHDFCGTFDGNHKTLTFTSTENVDGVAPFSYISETTPTGGSEVSHPAIRNLNVVVNINTTATHASGLVGRQWGTLTIEDCTVSGTITTSAKYAAGFIGQMNGSANITDCVSNVTIQSSVNGDGTHGGFVAATSHTLNIEGCLFNGSLLGESTHSCGGFVGWRNGTVNISNSLFAPAEVNIGVGTDYPSATFSRNGVSNITNCYYTDAFGTAQGKQRHSITAGANTTVANAGTATTYDVSGITSYGTGILYGGVLYAGNGDAVSLTLAHQELEGYDFIGYTATAGNLNGSTLTMPDENVTINAEYTCTAPSELTATDITFTTATLNWNGFQESYSVRYRTVGANEWQTIGGIAATTTTLSGLLSGTTYEWQVQGLDCDGNGGTTEWSATATFTTLSPCEVQPSELTATDITFTTATLNWNGLQESYSVRYRPTIVILNEGFESGTIPDGWTRTGAYWQVTSGTGDDGYTGAATGNYNAGCYINNSYDSDILITPVMDLGNVASATLSFNFWNTVDYGDINILNVYYRVDEGEWQSLYTYEDATDRWISVTINLEGMAANYQIGFECESLFSFGMGIDDVKVIDNGAWTTENNVLNPFTLTSLTPETPYVWQVQGLECNGEGSTTEWSEAGTFTTLNPCETPYNLTATDITATTATLSWSGVQDSYNVRYRELTLGDEVTATEDFEHDGDMPEGWTMLDQGNVPDNADELGISNYAAQNGTYGFRFSSYNGDEHDSFDQYLISPELNNLTALSFYYRAHISGNEETFRVGYSTTTNDVSAFTWVSNMTASSNAFSRFDANNIPAHAKYFAINYTAIYLYYLYIDDITYTYTPLVPVEWDEANTNVTNPITITGLTPETQYQWQVQGINCNGEGSTTEWSEAGTFTTLAGIDLTVAGYEEGNGGWVFIASPVAGSIAPSEVHNLFPSAGETSNEYDLYRFNQSANKEWENYKAHSSDFNLVNGQGYLYATKETRTLMFAGEFRATTEPVEVPLDYDATAQLKGWNLVGNPFAVGATSSQPYYRMNEGGTALSAQVEAGNTVEAMEGVFVQATAANQTVTFTTQTRGGEQATIAQANIMVGGDNGAVIDNAIIRFDGGQTLEKFSFREGSTKIYIPQDGTDYAIACAESTGEMPLNFKAEENGTYTLTISTTLNSQHSTLNYLHLIDNLTGADVDLLTPPACGHPLSEGEAQSGAELGEETAAGRIPPLRGGQGESKQPSYTFTAKTTDYESRFKLVFSICEDANGDNEAFAFISNGNIIVNGEGTLQVFDVLGHQLVTKQLSTLNSQLSTTPRASMCCG